MRFAAMIASLLFTISIAHGETFDSIASVINNEAITCFEIKQDAKNLLLQLNQSGSKQLPAAAELNKRILDARITKVLQLQEARKLELKVSDDELAKAIGSIEANNRLLPGQLQEVLQQQGMDFDEYKINLREQLLISKLIDVAVRSKLKVSEESMREFYRKFLASSKPRREVKLAQIFLALPSEPNPRQLKAVRDKMRAIHQKLLDGGDFTLLATLLSDTPEGNPGGEMGWFMPGGISPRFASTLELPVNGISEPIRSPEGFHIFKVLEERWHEPETQGESYDETHARHILLQIPSTADNATRAKIHHRAETIAAELQGASEEEFITRAKEVSQDPSASNGGDLGWFKKGMMVPAFEKAASELQAGQTSGVVESSFGLHIIYIVAKRHIDPNSFEAHRAKIQQILTNVEIQEQLPRWLSGLKAKANIQKRTCPGIELEISSLIQTLTGSKPSENSDASPDQEKPVATQQPETDKASLLAMIESWRQAWNSRNMPAYFSFYSEKFVPGKGFSSLDQWKTERKLSISSKTHIEITISNIQINHVKNDRVEVNFDQRYESDNAKLNDHKLLILDNTADGWKIIRELTGFY
jgi:peptidyl-prolyl cis-trans isomerase SurA